MHLERGRRQPSTAATTRDAIVVNEIPVSTLTSLANQLNELFSPAVASYAIVGATTDDVKAKVLVNEASMTARSTSSGRL